MIYLITDAWMAPVAFFDFFLSYVKQIDSMLPCVCEGSQRTPKCGKEHQWHIRLSHRVRLFVLTTFHLWSYSITKQTHGNMKSIVAMYYASVNHLLKKPKGRRAGDVSISGPFKHRCSWETDVNRGSRLFSTLAHIIDCQNKIPPIH